MDKAEAMGSKLAHFTYPGSATQITLILIAVFTLLAAYASRLFFTYLKNRPKNKIFLREIGKAFYGPSMWVILIFGALTLFAYILLINELPKYEDYILRLRMILLLSSVGFFGIRVIRGYEGASLHKVGQSKEKQALVLALSKVATVVFLLVVLLGVLDQLGVPLSAILAFGGVGSLAVGWAAKDFIANLFGGLMVHINRPFTVGDWIMSPNKSFEGVVEEIGWYLTRIRTFDRRPTFIPNGLLTDAIVQNPGRMYNRRIRTIIGLRYDDVEKAGDVVEGIRNLLKNHSCIDQKQILMVHLVEFAAYSVNIEVYCFTKTTAWEQFRIIQQDVLLRIAALVKKHGAEFAFPTSTVHLHQENES